MVRPFLCSGIKAGGRKATPGELHSAALRSGPSHNLLRPAFAELVSCGPRPPTLARGCASPLECLSARQAHFIYSVKMKNLLF